jgi:hypothetical protein
MAYGPLELTPREFSELTVGEFESLLDGARWREERTRETAGWMLAWIVNACGKSKKRVSMEQILGPEYTKKVVARLKAEKERKADGGQRR